MKYRFRTKPYRHQREAIKFAFSRFREGANPAFLMEPRTGKSKTTIDVLSILSIKEGLHKVVIVCPNRVIGTWVEEFATHCPLVYQTVVWDKESRKTPLPSTSGHYDLQVILVNYEAFSTPGRKLASGRRSSKTGRMKHRALLRKWIGKDDAACVLDESHKIKSPSSKAALMLVSMRDDFRYRFLLTGTVQTKAKRAHDIYMQWKFLNPDRFPEWPTVEDFKNATGRWIDKNGYPQWLAARPAGMMRLKARVHMDSFVVHRADCFDLPPVDTQIIKVPLTGSARVYDEMAEEMVARLESGEIAEASIPLVVTLRLLQITSGFVGVREKSLVRGRPKMVTRPVRVGFEKINALETILTEEILERDEKVIIAAQFNFDMDSIVELCRGYRIPTFELRGKIKPAIADESRRKFNRMDGPAVFVVQPQAASLGIDLRTSYRTIWYSLTSSWVNYTQTCDRNALSTTPRIMTYLLAKDTVDETLYETLQLDGEVARDIMKKPRRLLRR